MNIIKIYLIICCLYYYEEIILEFIYNFYNLTTLKNNDNTIIEKFNKLLIPIIMCEYVKNIGIKSIINLVFIAIVFNIYPSINNYYIYCAMFVFMYEKFLTTLKNNKYYKYLLSYQFMIIILNIIMYVNNDIKKNNVLNVIYINNFAIGYIFDWIETY